MINETILLGEGVPSGALLKIEIEVFDKGDDLFVTYGAFKKDRQKGGTATLDRAVLKEHLIKKISKICDELV